MQLMENGELRFVNSEEERQIWSGISYLYGVDLRHSPSQYLHTDEEIRTAMAEKLYS